MDQTTIDNIDKNYRNRLRTLLAVDDMIADLIQTLEQNEILENTYLFFLTDHGWHDGEHRLADRKGTAYEEAIRIPLMIRGPGVAAGVSSKAIVSTIDLLPTFVDLAIGRAPLDVDGRSLVPILATGQTNNWRKRLLVEFLPEIGYVPRYQALRTENYSFVHYIDTGEEELYKMTNDPYQLRSTHDEVAPSVLDLLREQLDSLVNCAGHSCRDADK
jgi:arylsulfatase A-like enzyme